MESVDTFLVVAVLFFTFFLISVIYGLGYSAGIRWCMKENQKVFDKVMAEHTSSEPN